MNRTSIMVCMLAIVFVMGVMVHHRFQCHEELQDTHTHPTDANEIFQTFYGTGPFVPRQLNPREDCTHFHYKKSCLKSWPPSTNYYDRLQRHRTVYPTGTPTGLSTQFVRRRAG